MSIEAGGLETGRWCKFGGGETSNRTHVGSKSRLNDQGQYMSTQPCSCIQIDGRADGHEGIGLLQNAKPLVFGARSGAVPGVFKLQGSQARRQMRQEEVNMAFGSSWLWKVHNPRTGHDGNTMGWTKETTRPDGRRKVAVVSGQ
jgi:hypothetical protein